MSKEYTATHVIMAKPPTAEMSAGTNMDRAQLAALGEAL